MTEHSSTETKELPNKPLIAGIASVSTALLLVVIKGAAFWYSGALSLLASLIDSALDAGLSILTFAALKYSLRPSDKDHRSGHGKMEGVAAIIQAGFITGSAVFLMLEALSRLFAPKEITSHGLGISVMVISILMSALLVYIQKKTREEVDSLAVESDQANYTTDIVVNIGIIGVLGLIWAGAPDWIDTVFAAGIVLFMLYTALGISRKGMDMLMDREVRDETRRRVIKTILEDKDVHGLHDLRVTRSGIKLFIAFDMEVDHALTLLAAHDIAKRVEESLLEDFPLAEIMIHIDPLGDTDDSRHQFHAEDPEFIQKVDESS